MKPPNKLRLFAALVVAAAFSFWTRDGWRRIWQAVAMWFDWLRSSEPHVDDAIYEKRMDCCRHKCVLWHSEMETCGTPLRPKNERGGCWCYMPSKSQFTNAQCWADTELLHPDFGWRHNDVT